VNIYADKYRDWADIRQLKKETASVISPGSCGNPDHAALATILEMGG